MAFPLLFFVILLASTVRDDLSGITFGVFAEGVVALVLLIGAFTWFYPARVIRTEVLSLREQPFVEAARMLGASDLRLMRHHILPHLALPILVLATLMIPVNILLEAGVSFLGLGIELPTASWGSLLATAWGTVRSPTTTSQSMTLWITLFPSVAILVTVLAFNVLGEGLRAALDPRSRRRA
jgi:peptide/nickel transport system permease protein